MGSEMCIRDRIWALPHLIICSPSESDGQSESHHAHRRQFPSVEYETSVKTLDSISYGSGMRWALSMFRTSIMAPLIIAFFSIAAFAEDARQFTCSGTMIEPSAMSPSPETVVLTLGPAQKVTLDLGKGVMNARRVSDNKIRLKFRTKDFEGEISTIPATYFSSTNLGI